MNCFIDNFYILVSLLISTSFASPLQRVGGSTTKSNIRFHYIGDGDIHPFDPTIDAASCAKESTFCERIENYPSTELNSISKETNKYAELFGEDIINEMIESRFGDVEDEETLCASQTRLVYPQVGLTRENTWRYILNEANYTQGVRVEECVEKGPCKMSKNFPLTYDARCKQNYVYRQLVSINEDGKIIKDLFQIPSCCQCVLFKVDKNYKNQLRT